MVALEISGNVLEGIDLAIFDKDGTIIDVHTYWANMVRLRAEHLADLLGLNEKEKRGVMNAMGVNVDKMCIKSEGPVGLKKREIVLQSGVDFLKSKGHPDRTDAFIKVFKEVDEISTSHFHEIIKPIDGLYSMVAELKHYGCKIAIATTDRTSRAVLAMDHLRIGGDIDLIIGADQVNRPKPDREIVDHICARLAVPAEKSVMVGDSVSDIQTGLNAGCLASIGVESGLTPSQELKAITPHVIPDISALIRISD